MRIPKHGARTQRLLAAMLAIVTLVGARASVAAEPETLVIVVNDAGPLVTASDAEVRDMFLGKIRLVAGVVVQPAQLEGPARTTFARVLLRMSEPEFELYWMRKAYEDGRLPPPVRTSAAEILRFVSSQPGAVGFVEKRSMRDASGVRVIREIHAEGGD